MKRIIVLVIMLLMVGVLSFAEEEETKKTNEECIMNEKFDFKKMEHWKLFGVGTFRLKLDDLNRALKDNGHTTFNENFLSIGSTHHYKYNQFIFGGDCYALVGFEDKQGSDKNYDSLFLGGYGMVKIGYDFVDQSDISLYPTIGIGFGAMYFSLEENKNVNFDEIMKNPSRGVRLTNYNFLLDFGVGLNKSFSCRNDSEEKKRDFAIGIETGYTLGIPINGWNRGGIDLVGTKNISNSPDFSMSGPYVRFNIGSVGIGEK